jgi:hypothetical protein
MTLRRMVLVRKAWVLAALVLAVVPPATTPAPTSASTACTATIPDATVAGDLLLAVTGPPAHATAVGVHYIGGDGTPLVTRWSGKTWDRINVPVTPGAVLIQFQAATTAGARTWAVGAFRNDRPEAGFVIDDRWQWTHPIDPGLEEDGFLGVAAEPDGTIWAVGKHQAGADYQPLIERWDASGWSVVASPRVEGSSVLKGVAVATDGSVYGVGWSVLPGGKTVPLVERFANGRWSVEHATGPGLLNAVAIQPDGTPLGVGWSPSDDGDHILTMQAAGHKWNTVASATGDPGRLTAIAVGEATVAVGMTFNDGIPQPLVVRLDGGWTPIDVSGEPASEPGGDQLLGVTGELGDFRAVGIRDETDAFASLSAAGTCTG